MAAKGIKGVRAAFLDAERDLTARHVKPDPSPETKRAGKGAGAWDGAPVAKLPPLCPVTPLGKDGDNSYFVDTLGQLRTVNVNKWGKKVILDLFAETPNYVTWAWPRFSKEGNINGVEVDDATSCLLKSASERGLFHPVDRVRGRGAWAVKATGEFLWHSGETLWKVERGRLVGVPAGAEVDGVFYPRRPPLLDPWQQPVGHDDTPAHELLAAFRCWQWERPKLDPVLLLGWIGCALASGALGWRPALFVTGDRGQGKSTLQAIIKDIIGDALHATADTTPAGIYQRIKQDSLPVAVDELEADADNRRAMGVIKLARLAASGAVMFRGGSEHEGVEFQARNCFFFSSINPPPLGPQDRSRMALLNLRKLDQGGRAPAIAGAIDTFGRQLLRQIMDGWEVFERELENWKDAMRAAGLDGRAQDTYGTLLAMATLLLGHAAIEAAGIPIAADHAAELGEFVALATAAERADQVDNWRSCLEHLLQSAIEAWKGGEKPTIGRVLDALESNEEPENEIGGALKWARARLEAAGLGIVPRSKVVPGADGWCLAVPTGPSPQLGKIYGGTVWGAGVWAHALKQGPADIVLRDWKPGVVKINRVAVRCVLIDLAAFDRETGGE